MARSVDQEKTKEDVFFLLGKKVMNKQITMKKEFLCFSPNFRASDRTQMWEFAAASFSSRHHVHSLQAFFIILSSKHHILQPLFINPEG